MKETKSTCDLCTKEHYAKGISSDPPVKWHEIKLSVAYKKKIYDGNKLMELVKRGLLRMGGDCKVITNYSQETILICDECEKVLNKQEGLLTFKDFLKWRRLL